MRNMISMTLIVVALGLVFSSCATTGGADYAAEAAGGADVFAWKNWNAPRRNNMYDRWEFNADGTFHFWHVHHGEPLDRGVYHYELKDGVITIVKEGDDAHNHKHYAYAFSGKTVTLTPVTHQNEEHDTSEHADAGHEGEDHTPAEHGASEHENSGGHKMGSLQKAAVTFTHAK